MASMNLDPSSALAEKYKGNRQVLEAAVLGRGADASIDPYSALRALQKLNVADKYEQMQKAMAGQPNQPSVAQQTLAKAAQTREPGDAPMPPIGPQGLQAPAPQGLGAMPVPEDTFNMAGGGIVAFAAGDEVTTGSRSTTRDYTLQTDVDPAERDAAMANYMKFSDPEGYYGAAREQLETLREMGPGDLEQAKGLAALQAAAALSQGSDFVRGLGAAGAAFGESYGGAVEAANKEKRALAQMDLELKNQERQEKLGNFKDAEASAERARLRENEAIKFAEEQRQFEINAGLKERELAAAFAAAAAKGSKDKLPEMLADAEVAFSTEIARAQKMGVETTPELEAAKTQVRALRYAMAQVRETPVDLANLTLKQKQQVAEDLAKWKMSPEYLEIPAEEKGAMEQAKRKELEAQVMSGTPTLPDANYGLGASTASLPRYDTLPEGYTPRNAPQ